MRICGSASLLRNACACAAALMCLILLPFPAARAQRLSPDVRPTHYDLKLTPDLKTATFSGVETIDMVLKQPGKAITLNSLEIEYQGATISAKGKLQKATVTSDKEKEQTTFTVPDEIPAGLAVLHIRYTGILNNQLRGFYLSKTERRNYAVTQFESTDARRGFPSFDEPAMKATFTLTMVVDKGDTVIGNTAIVAETPGPGEDKHTLRLEETPKMSTYLLAFLVGDFKCTNAVEDGVKLGVCATPDKVELTPYALDVAKFVLHYYDDYFGIHFPLKKLDLIGLPDFEAGAMENFGAITYRETDLLIDAKMASIGTKKNVAEVVAHEMAHQWFGDLVTMQWWNNVWLNEGFATWMENKPVAAMHPEWNIPQDVADGLDGTMNLDAQPTTRAIRAKAETREEIEQMFDGISYGKAGAVLNMVENYLGRETFRQGVHKYLTEHEYGNATAEDFWNAQTAVSHKPVDRIMDSMVTQPGVPQLTFGEPENGTVSVEQRRFYLSPSISSNRAQSGANEAQKWTLPVCFKTASGQQCEVLTPDATRLKVPAGALLFANADGVGYYRSSYPADKYAALVAQVESGLKPAERVILIGDEWDKVRADKATVGDYLNLVAAVKADSNGSVVESAMNGVAAIYDRVAATEGEKEGIAKWLRANFSPEYARLGPPEASDAPNKRELRAELFSGLGHYAKDPQVLTEAQGIAEKYLDDPGSVDPTLGQAALPIAARNGDAALFDKLQKVYETSRNPELSIAALRLLAKFEDPALEERALEYAATDKVRNQDAATQFAIALAEDATRDRAWDFVKSHWETVHALLTPELGNELVGSTGSFCSAEAREDVQQFFAAHPVASADQAVRHSIENIDGCMEFRQLQRESLKTWLDKQ